MITEKPLIGEGSLNFNSIQLRHRFFFLANSNLSSGVLPLNCSQQYIRCNYEQTRQEDIFQRFISASCVNNVNFDIFPLDDDAALSANFCRTTLSLLGNDGPSVRHSRTFFWRSTIICSGTLSS